MFELSVHGHFSAAHCLEGYPGACAKVHGHNYAVETVVSVRKLDKLGLAMDFRDLKGHLSDVLSNLDHENLNEIKPFCGKDPSRNPSAENIARHIFQEMKKRLGKSGARLEKVRISESQGSSVAYSADGE